MMCQRQRQWFCRRKIFEKNRPAANDCDYAISVHLFDVYGGPPLQYGFASYIV